MDLCEPWREGGSQPLVGTCVPLTPVGTSALQRHGTAFGFPCCLFITQDRGSALAQKGLIT